MAYFVIALIELAIDLFSAMRRRFKKKRLVMSRSSARRSGVMRTTWLATGSPATEVEKAKTGLVGARCAGSPVKAGGPPL